MDRREIVKAILFKGLAKNGKLTTPSNDWIREQLMRIYSSRSDTKCIPFTDYEKLPDRSIEGTFYFEELPNNQFRPVPYKETKSIRCVTLNIATIGKAYLNKESATVTIKLKIMAFLFDYPLTDRQIEVLDRKRDNTDTTILLKNYLSSIQLAYKKEDVLAQIVNILTIENHSTVTICTNDIQFIILLSPTLIEFLHKGKKLFLLYDPPSMYDLVSYRLMLLQQFGASVYILPIKNKYPIHGVFPGWDVTKEDPKIEHAILFTTSLFNEIREGRVFAKKIDSFIEIQDLTKKIRLHHDKIHPSLSAIALKDNYALNIEAVSEKKYVDYLKNVFGTQTPNSIYSNAEFKMETIPLESINRRKDTFTKFRLAQQYYFMEYARAQGWIEIDTINSTLIFKPLFIKMTEVAISPINPPFVEYNSLENRYEIEEGHIRLWLCYHVYNVQNVRVVLVENIPKQHFKIIDKNIVEKRRLQDKISWEETISQTRDESIHSEDYYLEPRKIEIITHFLPRKILNCLMGNLINELVEHKILSDSDKAFHEYLR